MAQSNEEQRDALEDRVRHLCETGDFDAAATVAIRGYGPELLGFLVAVHRNEADAGDVFSNFSERLWNSLPTFAWRSRLRTWAYTLARRSSADFFRSPRARRGREIPISRAPAAAEAAASVRSLTATYLRTAVKDRVARIREELSPEDRLLLVLRVDRELPWKEVAQIMLEDDTVGADSLRRESARLRKRFELVKAKILEIGKREGLIGSS